MSSYKKTRIPGNFCPEKRRLPCRQRGRATRLHHVGPAACMAPASSSSARIRQLFASIVSSSREPSSLRYNTASVRQAAGTASGLPCKTSRPFPPARELLRTGKAVCAGPLRPEHREAMCTERSPAPCRQDGQTVSVVRLATARQAAGFIGQPGLPWQTDSCHTLRAYYP